MILAGAGQIGMAIARRMGYGMKIIVADKSQANANADMIAEVSLLLAPGIDGREGWRAMFDGIADQSKLPTKLTLRSVEKTGDDVLWIRYDVVR